VKYLTSFAVEDLPSDYLGFVMAARHLSPAQTFAYLGAVTGSNTQPTRAVRNYAFSPLVNGVQVPWPRELAITPIGSETGAWRFVGDWGSNNLHTEAAKATMGQIFENYTKYMFLPH
jgi:hypothetical protein